jgi:hypothetical protein
MLAGCTNIDDAGAKVAENGQFITLTVATATAWDV